MERRSYRNPVIPGFHPDPSICRVGEDYYVVTSSFEYFPGVPIFHSRDLTHWECIGNCLTRPSRLSLAGCSPSKGIYAPTLRYHDGWYFMTTTNVSGGGNFIVYSRDPRGEWSDPVWIDQGGIDPSLFFDNDGKVYFSSACGDGQGRNCILTCELDPFSGRKYGESRVISYGCGGSWPEGPHLYRIGNLYYLMLAEGGTEYGHMETMQRALHPYGPYEPCPYNPILTQCGDMRGRVFCTGHADMTEDGKGNWWAVCLGVRTCGSAAGSVFLHNLGRETFLVPVRWTEDGWPICGEERRTDLCMEGLLPAAQEVGCLNFRDNFSAETFSPRYSWLRNPEKENYHRLPAGKTLYLRGTEVTLNEAASPTWVGIRQPEFVCTATVRVRLAPHEDGVHAGLTAYYNNSYHYEIYLTYTAGEYRVEFARHVHDLYVVTSGASIGAEEAEHIRLRIETGRNVYRFSYSTDGMVYTELGSGMTAGLCTEGTATMTYTGTFLSMYAEHGSAFFSDYEVLADVSE